MIPLIFAVICVVLFLGYLLNTKSIEGKLLLGMVIISFILFLMTSIYYFG